MPEAELSPALFALFATLVEQAAGLHYAERDRELFAAKLIAYVEEQGAGSLLDYYYRLRYDDPGRVELSRLVDALLVHETYFFRELPQLVALVDTHLAAVVRERGRARVWSAACSTGEEPYTLAMLLADRGLLDRVEIVATDLSASTVARARAGQHGSRALRDAHPAQIAARYLEVTRAGIVVAPQIRAAVRFDTYNLVGPPEGTSGADLGRFDAILCRNVLIYFADDQVARVIARLAGRLEPGGVLAVGVSESLLRFGTLLICEERGGAFFYRLPDRARR